MTTAADKLDRIRGGGSMMVVNCLNRIQEAQKHIQAGEFTAANQSVSSVYAMTQELSRLDLLIGSFADASPVLVGDLREGMILHEIGEITNIDFDKCHDGCQGHADITCGDSEIRLDCHFEVLVDRDG